VEMAQIKYVLAAAKALNFTKAALDCNISQPALTKGVKALEEELGGLIFHREGFPVIWSAPLPTSSSTTIIGAITRAWTISHQPTSTSAKARVFCNDERRSKRKTIEQRRRLHLENAT
jgi:hypothetical protein